MTKVLNWLNTSKIRGIVGGTISKGGVSDAQKIKIVLIFFIGLIILGLVTVQANHESGHIVAVNVSPSSLAVLSVNETFTINITVDNVTDLYDFNFSIAFNPGILNATGVTEGPFLSSDGEATVCDSYTIDNTAGTIAGYHCYRDEIDYGVNGSGVLATITFNATEVGISTLDLTYISLKNSTPQEIPASANNGTIYVDIPLITITSPQNDTYTTSSVDLNYSVSESTSWEGYNLDGNATNVTLIGNTTLSGLLDGPHNVTVYANDTAGNMGQSTVYFTINVNPPIISNVTNTSITYSSAVITWTTDETSDSLVRYGNSSSSYTFNQSDSVYVTSHTVTLTNLSANTTYYYVVNSTDQNGKSNQSIEYSFTTGKVYTVCSSGCDYAAIQDAVNAASGEEKVYVYNGTYNENVVLNKSLTLQGEDRDITIIDCLGSGNCIDVNAGKVDISEFTVQNGSYGIYLSSSGNVTIANNNITLNKFDGIFLSSSNNNTIVNNTVTNNTYSGIFLTMSNNNTIMNNNVTLNNYYYGIGLNASNNNTIDGNNASSNWYGVYIHNSTDNLVKNNSANDNTYYGIYLSSSNSSTVDNNTASRNYFGIAVISSDATNIYNNNASANDYAGIFIEGGTANYIGGGNIAVGGDTFASDTYGVRLVVDDTWKTASNNATYIVKIDNFGIANDTFDLEVINYDSANYSFDNSSVALNPGETETRELVVGNGTNGTYTISIKAVSQTNADVDDQVNITTIIAGSSLIDEDSTYDGLSNFIDSAILNSTITNSTILESIITSSTVTNSTLENVLLTNGNVMNGNISRGNITIGGITYEITDSIAISELVTGRDDEDNTLVGVSNTELYVSAGSSNATFNISAAGDYIGGAMSVQRSGVQPRGILKQENITGGYTDVEPSKNIKGSLDRVYIKIYYNESQLGNINESTLRMQFFNTASRAWETITLSGVNETENYVWANSTHFSVLVLHGDIKPIEQTPEESQSSQGSTGGEATISISLLSEQSFTTLTSSVMNDVIQRQNLEYKQFYDAPMTLAATLIMLDEYPKPSSMDIVLEKPMKTLEGDVYELSAEKVLEKYTISKTIVIARGDDPADTMAATAYAKSRRLPILLTMSGELPRVTLDAIQKLKTDKVIIIGGSVAVSEQVEEELKDIATIERKAGETRYETALELANTIEDPDVIVITYGHNPMVDAVIVSAVYNAPLIYVSPEEIPQAVRDYLKQHKKAKVLTVGVGDSVNAEIQRLMVT